MAMPTHWYYGGPVVIKIYEVRSHSVCNIIYVKVNILYKLYLINECNSDMVCKYICAGFVGATRFVLLSHEDSPKSRLIMARSRATLGA